MTEVEYVGHLINELGLNFSKDKKALVANWERPTDKGGLKSFVGLAGYFRRHIRGYAELVHPLNELCEGYEKKKKGSKLEWDELSTKAFIDTQDAIVNCQTLFFRDHSAPLRVYTDASDYGIGAYLCQVIDNEEQPIAFISKTLSKAEKKWSVYEKEAFAIFYSLRKWDTIYKTLNSRFSQTTKTSHTLIRIRVQRLCDGKWQCKSTTSTWLTLRVIRT